MTLYNVKNIDKLFELIDKCKGDVYLLSPDMSLNLKSKLAQYFALAKVFNEGDDLVKEINIQAKEPEDRIMLINALVGGAFE